MGRGKSTSDSKPAYSDEKNAAVDNNVFMSKQSILTKDMREEEARNDGSEVKKEAYDKHGAKFYTKCFTNSSNKVKLTRIVTTIKGKDATDKFYTFVSEYEKNNDIKLAAVSKEELLFRFLDYVEQNNAVLEVEDDSGQFLTYRFKCPVLKLYLYKAFYPRIFDYTLNEDNTLHFRSEYIKHNFENIYQQIEELARIIVYDATIIAVSDTCADIFNTMKRSCDISILPNDTFEDFKFHLENQLNDMKRNDSRWGVLRYFIPSIFFFTKHYGYVYRDRDPETKRIISLLNSNTFYRGKRGDESRAGLPVANNECVGILRTEERFTKLLNLHYVNKRSHLLDLILMKNNRGFAPYLISGILTKQHINDMIIKNAETLGLNIKGSKLDLTSIYNNPNCILYNLNSRDYEIIDYVITRAASSMRSYYLPESFTPQKLFGFIEWMNTEKNSEIFGKKITPTRVDDIHNVDYSEIMEFELKNIEGDRLTGFDQTLE
ncbi:MAG: hypothetical protein Q8876_09345 [Bacillota bacterium]|nr:hypothetical protein [Bacillota bacterium]